MNGDLNLLPGAHEEVCTSFEISDAKSFRPINQNQVSY